VAYQENITMTTWKIDPAHSQVQFSVKHMMISTVRGHFDQFEADATINPADISQSKVTAKVQAASIQTGEPQRDGHLKSPDFFDVETFPQLSLVSKKVKADGEDLVVDVDLTIRDVTKPVQLKGEVQGPAKDPWGNQRVAFSLTGEINREDFGLTWNQALEAGGVLVGKKVKLHLEVQFVGS